MMNKNNNTLANWVGVKGKCTIFITAGLEVVEFFVVVGVSWEISEHHSQ